MTWFLGALAMLADLGDVDRMCYGCSSPPRMKQPGASMRYTEFVATDAHGDRRQCA